MKALRFLLLACAALPLGAPADDKAKKVPTLGTIERLDPAFDKLIAKDAVLERLAGGFTWVEGPVWDKKNDCLYFSDIPTNSVYKWQEGKKPVLFLRPSGYTGTRTDYMEPGSNGLLLDSDNRLVLMQHGDRRVARLNKDGKTFTVLAEKYMGKRLNSPNDGAFKSNGDLYFTDPPYGQMRKGKPWIFPRRGTGLSRSLPPVQGRQTDTPDEGDELPQRHRLLPRREETLRRPVRPEEGDLDGVPGQEGRHAG
jgi:gluconolactonase